MTVSSTIAVKKLAGDSSSILFPIAYKIFAKVDVEVFAQFAADSVEVLKTLDVDYSVSSIDTDNETFDVVFLTGIPQTGTFVTVNRILAQTQVIDYISNDSFPAETHEEGLDRSVLLVQQNSAVNDRSLTLPVTLPPGVSSDLPLPQANTFLAWNAIANALINAVGTVSGVIATIFGALLVQTADNVAARTLLDVLSTTDSLARGQIQNGVAVSADDTGGTNAIVITLSPAVTSYVKFQQFRILVAATNTGATTIDVNGLGTRNLLLPSGEALVAGDITSASVIGVLFDGTQFLLVSTPASLLSSILHPVPPAPQVEVGDIFATARVSVGTGFHLCDGDAKPNNTDEALLDVLLVNMDNFGIPTKIHDFTVDTATDQLISIAHGLILNDIIYLDSTTTLPAGLVRLTLYHVVGTISGDRYQVALTQGGTPIVITDTGTGTHSTFDSFSVPDARGRQLLGKDNMGVGSANRVTASQADNIGQGVGAEDHTLGVANLAAHGHIQRGENAGAGVPGSLQTTASVGALNADSTLATGSGTAVNQMNPYLTLNMKVKR